MNDIERERASTQDVEDDGDVEWYVSVDTADVDAGVFRLDVGDFDGRSFDGEASVAAHFRLAGR